jgi:chromosome segregation ATPase
MAGSHLERSPPSVRHRDESQNEPPSKWNNHAGGVRVVEPSVQDSSMMSDGAESAENQWDSTVGKAGLGKTGRVINKLVSDNDALKRDLQIERLRADESKQAAKLVEDKMERMINEYESKLLEANVTKTLLSRKERQVENLTATVDMEKKKAQAALEREKSWRDELEKTRKDSTIQVEEATTLAQLMEGRYNAISSHWKDQGMEVDKAVAKMRKDIQAIVAERKDDDNKIQTLRDLCDQQDINIKELLREKEEIAQKFEEYKQAQDDDLRAIKTNARGRQEEQERLLQESRDALDKLRWALNVKKNVEGAQ